MQGKPLNSIQDSGLVSRRPQRPVPPPHGDTARATAVRLRATAVSTHASSQSWDSPSRTTCFQDHLWGSPPQSTV